MTPEVPPGMFVSGPLALRDAALFTDLYELTMAASYFREGMHEEPAAFSLFVRRLPPGRSFLVAAGLEDALAYLQSLRFSEAAIAYLDSLRRFPPDFLDYLRSLRFTGEVRALPEGTVFLADEPLLEVRAPAVEAQLVETAVINFCHLQTLLASKAARCVIAARGRPVIDFGLRRAHGIDAGMKAARASYIAGAVMSSNVLAGEYYRIPPTGTMAHSYVSAFPREADAFRAFARAFPDNTVLLLDTYDTLAGARTAAAVGRELEAAGRRLFAVRLDSGDVLSLSREVRRILDEAGLMSVRIVVSGGLDEMDVERFVEAGAPIDVFAVGTRMDVSADAPYLDIAYKLVSFGGRDVMKQSTGKRTWPGEKQVYRFRDTDGRYAGDLVALRDEPPPEGGEPLLRTVMEDGQPVLPGETLDAMRERCAAQIAALPEDVRRLRSGALYPVRYSERLIALTRAVEQQSGTEI